MTDYYMDTDGNYIGGFDGGAGPADDTAIKIDNPPPDARMRWNGTTWVDNAELIVERTKRAEYRAAFDAIADENVKTILEPLIKAALRA